MTGHVEEHLQRWLDEFVVGLNLCPFARPLLGAANLRIAVCEETDTPALRRAFLAELDLLQRSPEQDIATTLLAFPRALQNFDDYLDFLEDAQDLLRAAGLEGLVQLASFHPDYRFAGEPPNAASHYSNRAPWPVIHLLREDMLTRALEEFADPQRIPDRNIETLTEIGADELARRWRALFAP
ncbi:MAG: DUF1415 domain-containing protein [Halioglobus sp.]|nr:DUF1415 domain-containing protein [Halioglobus sp.]